MCLPLSPTNVASEDGIATVQVLLEASAGKHMADLQGWKIPLAAVKGYHSFVKVLLASLVHAIPMIN